MSGQATAVLYLRVSTKEQAERDGDPEGYSIPAQRAANLRKAEELGAVVTEEFVDRGESARSADRPQLKAMLEFVREQRVTYVIVHKVDRLARNRMDDVEISLALRAAGTTLVSVSESIDDTPSGMLLHGIMSSIAEYYSRNLATEVVKGMTQKVKAGGTPNRAPLGYLNVRTVGLDGTEARGIALDPERAPLVRWAFEAYAGGEWTLNSLTAELEARGLMSRPSPKWPSRPVTVSGVQKMLRSPYYTGVVAWNGAIYPGRHEPLIGVELWQKVQDLLDQRRVGEKARRHQSYLKSTVYCGDCKSRMIITHARSQTGAIYPYFICSGRHAKRTACQRPAVLIASVEQSIIDYYRALELPEELRRQIGEVLSAELSAKQKEADRERRDLNLQVQRLKKEQSKVLQAHYADAIPLDLMKSEQDRIGRGMAAAEARLGALDASFDLVIQNAQQALELVGDIGRAYAEAPDHIRRAINQALFTRIFIEDDRVRGELAEPFRTIFDELVTVEGAERDQDTEDARDSDHGRFTAVLDAELLRRQRSRRTNKPALCRYGAGLSVNSLVPPVGVEPTTFRLGGGCSIH